MSLRVVGAGLPRTATKSLQLAIERLIGGRCYHMHEVFARLDHVPVWRAALDGELPDWDSFLGEYAAAVDWPASAFWKELSTANPDSLVVLSVREDAATWWRSANGTILDVARLDEYPEAPQWFELFHQLLEAQLGEDWGDAEAAMAAYERHNDDVRVSAPNDRLLEWTPRDGWTPLCAALDVSVPPEPFPHVNTTEEWKRDLR
jgi:Sulfotransferase domain